MDKKLCPRCGQNRPVALFYRYVRRGAEHFQSWCKPCYHEYKLLQNEPRKTAVAERKREAAESPTKLCRHCLTTKSKDSFDLMPRGGRTYLDSWCRTCRISYSAARYRSEDHEARRRRERENHRQHRMDALIAYGGDPPQCACCGEAHWEFLEFDHINNDGAAHRQLLGPYGGGPKVVSWLRRNGYPPGFQILCSNCNRAKQYHGVCPHQNERSGWTIGPGPE